MASDDSRTPNANRPTISLALRQLRPRSGISSRHALHATTINYDGRAYEVVIPDLELPTCANCGEVIFDNHTGHQINRALRQQLGLLQPEQIRAGRTQLGLNQRDFAALLGAAEESVSRWETGAQMQSRVVDRQIRVFFAFPEVRTALSQIQQGAPIGGTVVDGNLPGAAATA